MFTGFILANNGNVSSKNTFISITPIIPEKKQKVIMAIAQDDISDNVLDEISDLIFRHEKDTENE